MANASDLSCAELVELVTDYFEDGLTPGDRARVEEHLDLCGACRAHVEQLRKTIELSGRLRVEDVPAEAATALLAAFRDWTSARRNASPS